jgi:hypothetical protein
MVTILIPFPVMGLQTAIHTNIFNFVKPGIIPPSPPAGPQGTGSDSAWKKSAESYSRMAKRYKKCY